MQKIIRLLFLATVSFATICNADGGVSLYDTKGYLGCVVLLQGKARVFPAVDVPEKKCRPLVASPLAASPVARPRRGEMLVDKFGDDTQMMRELEDLLAPTPVPELIAGPTKECKFSLNATDRKYLEDLLRQMESGLFADRERAQRLLQQFIDRLIERGIDPFCILDKLDRFFSTLKLTSEQRGRTLYSRETTAAIAINPYDCDANGKGDYCGCQLKCDDPTKTRFFETEEASWFDCGRFNPVPGCEWIRLFHP